jgi:hypothetical protein
MTIAFINPNTLVIKLKEESPEYVKLTSGLSFVLSNGRIEYRTKDGTVYIRGFYEAVAYRDVDTVEEINVTDVLDTILVDSELVKKILQNPEEQHKLLTSMKENILYSFLKILHNTAKKSS